MNKHDKPASFERPLLAHMERPPALSPKKKKAVTFLRNCLIAGLMGALISLLMNYPFDFFQMNNSEEYKLYRQALQEYHDYEATHRQRPTGLEYLSAELRKLVDREGSCLVSRNEGRELVCLTYFPGWQWRKRGAAQYLGTLFRTPHIVMAVIPEPQNCVRDIESPSSTQK